VNFLFMSGLPRSGSTLLMAFLNQNPALYAGPPSGLLDVLFNTRKQWDTLVQHQAISEDLSERRKLDVLRAIMTGYYHNCAYPNVIDNNRGWTAYIELLEMVLGEQVKLLVPVRSPREILASLELRWRHTVQTHHFEGGDFFKMQTVAGRCAYWSQADQVFGLAYNRIKDVIARGYRDRLFFVDYDTFTVTPLVVVQHIYEFLELPLYAEHNPDLVVVTEDINDRAHAFNNLHAIRPKIKPRQSCWEEVLGEAGKLYPARCEFY